LTEDDDNDDDKVNNENQFFSITKQTLKGKQRRQHQAPNHHNAETEQHVVVNTSNTLQFLQRGL